MKLVAFLLAIPPLALVALDGQAQPCPADTPREDLITRAIAAQRQRDHESALTLARCAAATRAPPLLRLFIATELNALNRLPEALEAARGCVTEAEADRTVPNRRAILRECGRLVESLEPRVREDEQRRQREQPTTFVEVTPPTPPPEGLRITLQGQELPRERWSARLPVAPGSVHVEATAPGRQPFARDVPITVGATATMQIELPSNTFVQVRPPTPAPPGLRITLGGRELPRARWNERVPVEPGSVLVEATAPNRERFSRSVPVAAGEASLVQVVLPATSAPPNNTPPQPSRLPNAGQWVVAGAGAAMLGGALATFFMEDDLRVEQEGHCAILDGTTTRVCRNERGYAIDDERSTLRVVNNVLFFGGLAAVAGAVTWYVIGRVRSSDRPTARWNLHLTPSATGVTVGVQGAL